MSVSQERGVCQVVSPSRRAKTLAEDVIEGLLEPPRALPSKYFYDARGSELFDRICDTAEYYPTRVEDALLARYAVDIIRRLRPRHILELGSGTSRKTRHLLSACGGRQGMTYWPFDVCQAVLEQTSDHLANEYPWVEINPLLGDYSTGLDHLPAPCGGCLYVFLGGTLGNFEESEAIVLLTELMVHMKSKDRLLLGIDRVKSGHIIQAAYDDTDGVTAEFNRNVLHVLNRELGGDFKPGSFAHRAVYNEVEARIEMYLVADTVQQVSLEALDVVLRFDVGECLLTEISRKFTLDSAARLLACAGLVIERHYTPDNQYFSLLVVAPQ